MLKEIFEGFRKIGHKVDLGNTIEYYNNNYQKVGHFSKVMNEAYDSLFRPIGKGAEGRKSLEALLKK